MAQALVAEDRLGEAEMAAKGLAKRLKAGLFKSIRTRLNTRLAETFENRMLDEETPEALMMMVALYYGSHLNRSIPGSWAPPFYFTVFLPFLVKSQKDGFRKSCAADAPASRVSGPLRAFPILARESLIQANQ